MNKSNISRITANDLEQIQRSYNLFAKNHFHFGFSPACFDPELSWDDFDNNPEKVKARELFRDGKISWKDYEKVPTLAEMKKKSAKNKA